MILHKKFILNCIFVAVAILIAGCDFITGNFSQRDFRVGNEGLTLQIEGENLIYIYGGDEYATNSFTLHMENRGTSHIENNDIYIRVNSPQGFIEMQNGESITELNTLSDTPTDVLYGRTEFTNQGDKGMHTITYNAYAPLQGATATINVDMCYRYTTKLQVPSLCLRTNPTVNDRNCRETYSFTQGQGAPVRISRVEINERRMDGEINHDLLLTITNAGRGITSLAEGDAFKEGCLARNEINKIRLSTINLGTQSLQCSGENNIISLQDGETTVRCQVPETIQSSEGLIHLPLTIELDYGYHVSANQRINIQRR
ncbi:MAG: hypothetical protein ACMXYE_00230 [Candidatus Woesearchaeota archaeon]